jgi:peptidyl-prolyl cis-trans isomerase C
MAGFRKAVTILALAAAIVACNKKAGGQVAAVVDGQEITDQDLRTEAVTENLKSKADFDAAAPTMVQKLVDRAVLSGYARKNNLDRGPEYVARRRQMEETLLAYLGLRKLIGTIPSPSEAEVSRFIDENPLMFSQRQRLTLDQFRFKTPADSAVLKRLTALDTPDQVAASLRSLGVQYSRTEAYFDSGTAPAPVARQIVKVPDGQMFNVSMGGESFISQIKSRASAAVDSSQWKEEAEAALRGAKLRTIVGQRLGELKKSSKIDIDAAYQSKAK